MKRRLKAVVSGDQLRNLIHVNQTANSRPWAGYPEKTVVCRDLSADRRDDGAFDVLAVIEEGTPGYADCIAVMGGSVDGRDYSPSLQAVPVYGLYDFADVFGESPVFEPA